MIIETGTIVFFSLIIMMWRMPRKAQLWFYGHPAWLEVPIAIVAYLLHYGTFSGMMAAAAACCICFCYVQMMRKLVGYTDAKGYHAGAMANWSRPT